MKLIFKLYFTLALGLTYLVAADFLMPDEAFKPYAKVNENMQIEAGVNIAKDIYLYADKLKIDLVDAKDLAIKEIKKPQSTKHKGDDVYTKSPNFIIILKNKGSNDQVEDVTLKISYRAVQRKACVMNLAAKYFI